MKKLIYLFAIIGLMSLVSCGGPQQEEAEQPEEEEPAMEEPAEEETTEAEPAAEEAKDIVALATETESLSTLVAAVKAGELVETLQGEGPYTVFAPTNEAFDALPEGTLDDLLKPENKDKLVSILTYHVIPSKVMSTDLQDGATVATVNGAEVTISTAEGAKVDNANVVTPDVEASNGVVHIIDAVIMPAEE